MAINNITLKIPWLRLKSIPVANTAIAEENVNALPKYEIVIISVITLNISAAIKPKPENIISASLLVLQFDLLEYFFCLKKNPRYPEIRPIIPKPVIWKIVHKPCTNSKLDIRAVIAPVT